MPQYKYLAITQDNQKMSGSLSASNEEEARKELNHLGLAILNIEEVHAATLPPEKPKETSRTPSAPPSIQQATVIPKKEDKIDPGKILVKFEFEALDKTGRKIIGTIPAQDKFSAFSRLTKEYQFDISYISKADAAEAEKDHDRQEGAALLKKQFEEIVETQKQVEKSVKNDEFTIKQQLLLQKVDFVLEKIKQVLASFEQEIKPENKKLIHGYIDKLLRIKNSTNLEYIEHTAEDLLKKIQDQELFLHKENMQKQRASLTVESQELLASLRSSHTPDKTFKEDLNEKITRFRYRPLRNLAKKGLELFKEDPEIVSVKSMIKTTNRQILTYIKIWITTKDKDAKNHIAESLKKIFEEKKNLKTKLKNLKKQKNSKAISPIRKSEEDTFSSESANFLGWLTAFYLGYYFYSHYISKEIDSTLFKYLVPTLFLWYILLATKTKFAPRQTYLTTIAIVIGIISTTLLIFNF